MTSMTELFSKKPSDFFLGVVEMENTIYVGVIDDPMGIELSAVRLAYPIELVQKWNGQDVDQAVIVPECGVSDEIVLDACHVAIHSGGSPFGLTYFKNLQDIARIRPKEFKIRQIPRHQIYKGEQPGGAR